MRLLVSVFLASVLAVGLWSCEPIQEKVQPTKEGKTGPWYQNGKRLQEVVYQDIRNLNNYVERPVYDSIGQCVGMAYTVSGRTTGSSKLDFTNQEVAGLYRTVVRQNNMPVWLWPSNTVSYTRARTVQTTSDTLWADVQLQEKFNASSRGRVAWLGGLHISTQASADVIMGPVSIKNTWTGTSALTAVVSSAGYNDTMQYALTTTAGMPVVLECAPVRNQWSCRASIGGSEPLPWTMAYRHLALSTAGLYVPAFTTLLGGLEQLPKLSSISYQVGGSTYSWGPVTAYSAGTDTVRYSIPFQAGTDRSTWQVTEIWK